jgi:hypothetical protein
VRGTFKGGIEMLIQKRQQTLATLFSHHKSAFKDMCRNSKNYTEP